MSGPGRPSKPTSEEKKPAPSKDSTPLKAGEAQRNLHATFRLGARVLRSDAQFAEKEFEDAAQGLLDTAREFPQAEPVIRAIVRALGPAVMAADLAEKMGRMFKTSGIKKDIEQRRAAWRPPWKRAEPAQEEERGPDNSPDV